MQLGQLLVTLVVSRAVFKILAHKARKHHLFRTPPLLEFGPTGNDVIRFADPENPSLEPNMQSIGCNVCL